jgi:DNA-binding response OmpR family regulator
MTQYVIVNDAESQVGASIISTLARQGILVTVAPDPADLTRQVTLHGPPGLLIYVIGDFEDEAIEAIIALRKTYDVLLLLVVDNEHNIAPDQPIWQHSNDFIVWQPNETELLLRVRRLLALDRQRSASVLPNVVADPKISDYEKSWANRIYEQNQWRQLLSPTELRIIEHLRSANGQVVAMDELAQCVSGVDEKSRIDALRVHISRIRKKLKDDLYMADSITTVRGNGYRIEVNRFR